MGRGDSRVRRRLRRDVPSPGRRRLRRPQGRHHRRTAPAPGRGGPAHAPVPGGGVASDHRGGHGASRRRAGALRGGSRPRRAGRRSPRPRDRAARRRRTPRGGPGPSAPPPERVPRHACGRRRRRSRPRPAHRRGTGRARARTGPDRRPPRPRSRRLISPRGPRRARPPGDVVARLRRAGCVAAEEEAGELSDAATDDATLEAMVRRREVGEPLAWITGTTRFCGRAVAVDPGVYVPRLQSEALARRAATLLAGSSRRRAADLCTGSGAVAVHLLASVDGAQVVAVDVDMAAVRCARRNGVPAVCADLGRPLRAASFDVVTAVAPYVPAAEIGFLPADARDHEPRRALDGGPDGLAVVRRVVAAAARLLSSGGWLLVEIGGDQDELLAPAMAEHGFSAVTPWHDDDGDL